jgi:hypothetical protein
MLFRCLFRGRYAVTGLPVNVDKGSTYVRYQVGSLVLTPVGMRNSVFWGMTPCSLSKMN